MHKGWLLSGVRREELAFPGTVQHGSGTTQHTIDWNTINTLSGNGPFQLSSLKRVASYVSVSWSIVAALVV